MAVTEFLAKATCKGLGDQQNGSAGGAHIQIGRESQFHRGALWHHSCTHPIIAEVSQRRRVILSHGFRAIMVGRACSGRGVRRDTHAIVRKQRRVVAGSRLVASLSLFAQAYLPPDRMVPSKSCLPPQLNLPEVTLTDIPEDVSPRWFWILSKLTGQSSHHAIYTGWCPQRGTPLRNLSLDPVLALTVWLYVSWITYSDPVFPHLQSKEAVSSCRHFICTFFSPHRTTYWCWQPSPLTLNAWMKRASGSPSVT